MKRMILCMIAGALVASAGYASELSFSGVVPVFGAYEWGIGGGFTGSGGTISTDDLELEVFYRKYMEESFDWGFSCGPLDLANFPGVLNFVFDLKCRLLKEASIIPNVVLGVNMVTTQLDTTSSGAAMTFNFLDGGRIGFSKTFETYKNSSIKKTEVYIGTYIVNQQIDSSNMYFGFKSGAMNLTVASGPTGLSFIGVSFIMSD